MAMNEVLEVEQGEILAIAKLFFERFELYLKVFKHNNIEFVPRITRSEIIVRQTGNILILEDGKGEQMTILF